MRTLSRSVPLRRVTGRWAYTLLTDKLQTEGFLGESYGIAIDDLLTGERAQVPRITQDLDEITAFLSTLARCAVTPTTLCDVVEDWLAR